MSQVLPALGRHILVELMGCESELLNHVPTIEKTLCEAAQKAGATLIQSTFHHFSPYGVSGVIVIQESHLAIHTWPEYGYAAIDLFTCGDTTDPWIAFDWIKRNLKAKSHSTLEMYRGSLAALGRSPFSAAKAPTSAGGPHSKYLGRRAKPKLKMERTLWFTDRDENQALSLRYRSGELFSERSRHQSVRVIDTYAYGKALTLDNRIMCTERDEFHYHEMVTHSALQTIQSPRRVLIIGGGDAGILREVLRYPSVEEVIVVELDETVVRASCAHLRWAKTAFNNKRVKLLFEDGSAFVKKQLAAQKKRSKSKRTPDRADGFDAIFLDGYDPDFGHRLPKDRPFGESFLRTCAKLLNTNGIFATQGESPIFREKAFIDLHRTLKLNFGLTRPLLFYSPTLPTGMWSIQLAKRPGKPPRTRVPASLPPQKPGASIASDAFLPWSASKTEQFCERHRLRYYDARIHHAAGVLPRFVRNLIKS